MIHTTIGAVRQRVPDPCPGIYIVGTGSEYLYVGKSKRCAWRRLRMHWGAWGDNLGTLVVGYAPDSNSWQVSVLPLASFPAVPLNAAERHLIVALRPMLNVTHGNSDPLPEWVATYLNPVTSLDLAKRAASRGGWLEA